MWGATEQNIERLVVATLLIKYWLRGGGGFKLILRPTPKLSNYIILNINQNKNYQKISTLNISFYAS